VEGIDRRAGVVRTSDGAIPFDRALIALGSGTDWERVPGAAEHAFSPCDEDAAERLAAHLAGGERLPVVVIGGGLTAIDTATESLAYYPVQVEKFLSRYEVLVAERGESAVKARWTPEEAEIAAEFIAHARAIREERAAAKREGREARQLLPADNLVADQDVRHSAPDEGFRLAHLLDALTDRPIGGLEMGDDGRFVGLRMRPQDHALAGNPVRHGRQIRLEGVKVDHQGGGLDLVLAHAGLGGRELEHGADPQH